MSDTYNLQRFVDAQEEIYPQVLTELRNGKKETHWMWFIFPQVRGLGASHTAMMFGIASREEARAYLEHTTLGPRLHECTLLVNLIESRSAEQVFDYPDYLKFGSSMTLFAAVSAESSIFETALEKFFQGQPDVLTLARL